MKGSGGVTVGVSQDTGVEPMKDHVSPENPDIDSRLRAVGFRILERPKRGEPIWTRGKIRFRQAEALLRLPPLEELAKQGKKC